VQQPHCEGAYKDTRQLPTSNSQLPTRLSSIGSWSLGVGS
jgi:hypothetical protein